MTAPSLNDSPRALRSQFYNATIAEMRMATDGLMIVRVAYDLGRPHIKPGQYLVLGLGNWEPRVDRILAVEPDREPKLVKRAYSVSCPLFEDDQIVGVNDGDLQEFCIRLVDRVSDRPAMLTPRLFCLKPGDRLYIGERPHGTYTLDPVTDSDTVALLASGTGEAPHNAMLAELLSRGHTGQIVCATCVRYESDLAYRSAHRELEERFSNYRYVPLTTREAWNTDAEHPDFRGRLHLQDWITSEATRREFGEWDRDGTHFYLCGSPAMIGLPSKNDEGEDMFPEPIGMAEVLTEMGFELDRPGRPGRIHVEKYW